MAAIEHESAIEIGVFELGACHSRPEVHCTVPPLWVFPTPGWQDSYRFIPSGTILVLCFLVCCYTIGYSAPTAALSTCIVTLNYVDRLRNRVHRILNIYYCTVSDWNPIRVTIMFCIKKQSNCRIKLNTLLVYSLFAFECYFVHRSIILGRIKCTPCNTRPIATGDPVAWCVSVTRLRPAKAAERIEVLFGVETFGTLYLMGFWSFYDKGREWEKYIPGASEKK